MLGKKEFDRKRKRRFNAMDATHKNKVSFDEFAEHLKTQESAMGRMD